MMVSRPAFGPFPPRWLSAAAVLLALSACGGGGSSSAPIPQPGPPATSPPPEPPATLTLAGSNTQALAGGKPVVLTATASANAGTLTWTLGAGNPGSLSASAGATVNYLPPAASAVSANAPVTITASGTGVSKSFALTLYPDPGPAGLSFIAGNPGGYGQIDGVGTSARFLSIAGVDRDAADNLYVVAVQVGNTSRNTIRKVTPPGVVATMVSTIIDSADGYVDGPAASAKLSAPTSVAVGADGTVFVLDKNGIRTISSAGVVGTLSTAFNNNSAQFDPVINGFRDNSGNRIASDGAGGLYVMERSRISKVSASGVVSGFAGLLDALNTPVDGVGAAARFQYLRDIAIDKAGTLFVIDGSAVRKISPGGQVSTLAGAAAQTSGGPQDGVGTAARFKDPTSLTVDGSGNVVVLDGTLQTIAYQTPYAPTIIVLKALRLVTPSGAVSTIKTGLLWVNAVRADVTGRTVLVGDGELSLLDVNGNLVPLAGKSNDTVIDLDGRGEQARLTRPEYIATDLAGTLYVIEDGVRDPTWRKQTGLALRKIAPDGTVTTLSDRSNWWGQPGTGNVVISDPSGIAVDRQGNLYISEAAASFNATTVLGGGSIVKITPAGVASVFAGKHINDTPQPTVRVDGTGEAAVFLNPKVLGFDADGNLYVDDGGVIRKITPDRVVTTVSALPAGFGADADGNLYVREGATIVRVASNGTRTVVAGAPGQPANKLGALPGNLYVAPQEPGALVRTGPASFAVISGSAILKLVLPH